MGLDRGVRILAQNARANPSVETRPRRRRRVTLTLPFLTNMTAGPEGVVRFYNGRGTAEQWIKEGKYALNWTRLSCHRFVANRVRLSLFVLAYNLGNFLRRLCLPKAVKH